MKKLFALMLTLLLVLPMTGLAADAEWTTYTHPTIPYQISYPADWVLISRETMSQLAESVTAGGVEGIDSAALENYKAQLQVLDMVSFISPTGDVNFNIQYHDLEAVLTVEDLKTGLCPAMAQELLGAFPNATTLVGGEILEAGDNQFAYIAIGYNINGMDAIAMQTYITEGTILYMTTFTVISSLVTDIDAVDATIEAICTSFVPSGK